MNDLSNKRIGNITSSEIVALTSKGSRPMTPEELAAHKFENPKSRKTTTEDFGAPFYTYIEECIAERFFKMTLENKVEVRAMSWGKLCEKIVDQLLGLEYTSQSDVTVAHPTIPEWLGTPDGLKIIGDRVDTVTDTKCPLTRKGFYNLVRFLYDFDGLTVTKKQDVDGNEIIKLIREQSKEGEKYYWQLVSNACIFDAKFAELIVFMPYHEDLEEIKNFNQELDEPFHNILFARDGELPFIYRESGIDNLNVIRFEVPQDDKDFLTRRVKAAIALINQ